MAIVNLIYSYIHYLIHPFETHQAFISGDDYKGFKPLKISVYESLTISWVFVVINGIFKIILLNFVLLFLLDLLDSSPFQISEIINIGEFSSYYLLIFSSLLDVVFYPLFGFFLIQFWEMIIRFYANALGIDDSAMKAQVIISVSLSSSILTVVPIFGNILQSFAKGLLLYAGLRKQLNASAVLSICILLTPIAILLAMISIFVVLFLAIS